MGDANSVEAQPGQAVMEDAIEEEKVAEDAAPRADEIIGEGKEEAEEPQEPLGEGEKRYVTVLTTCFGNEK